MDTRAMQGFGITQCHLDALLKFFFSAGNAGSATGVAIPCLVNAGRVGATGGCIEQHLLQMVGFEACS